MRYKFLTAAFAATAALNFAGPAAATDLEVTHWWTSGGEAAAVAELAKAFDATGKWTEVVRPKSLLHSCTIGGKIYCVPVNIHSWQWLWLSNEAFQKAGVPMPKNWDEFVAAAPALEKAGIIPLAVGGQAWQASGAFDVLMAAVGGTDTFLKV